jgi:hypothetical protein
MAKVIFEFDMDEDAERIDITINGHKYKDQLDKVWEELFRPRWKHGYPNADLDKLTENEEVGKALDILEKMFQDILKEE